MKINETLLRILLGITFITVVISIFSDVQYLWILFQGHPSLGNFLFKLQMFFINWTFISLFLSDFLLTQIGYNMTGDHIIIFLILRFNDFILLAPFIGLEESWSPKYTHLNSFSPSFLSSKKFYLLIFIPLWLIELLIFSIIALPYLFLPNIAFQPVFMIVYNNRIVLLFYLVHILYKQKKNGSIRQGNLEENNLTFNDEGAITYLTEGVLFEDRKVLLSTFHRKSHYQVHLNKDDITGKCAVCKLSIHASEDVLQCPSCGASAHRYHFLEWIKIKGDCPNCQTRLKKSDLTP
ncbi:MAG: hypothetical protein ACTSRS_15825 [Candidatus Helarchaeota archaeon]